jgi:cell division protein FtsZ
MLFITAGMGGGTGTGAAPIIAQLAKEMGILVVAVVTKPFRFEMQKRERTAQAGIDELQKHVDSLIVVPNEKLIQVLGRNISLPAAFAASNDVLHGAVAGISEIINKRGLVNRDFADVRTIMSELGMAMMGTATACGEDRGKVAAMAAIKSPLLEDVDLQGARGVLLNITTSSNVELGELYDVTDTVAEFVSADATVLWGHVIDEDMGDEMRVTMVATGLGAKRKMQAVQGGMANAPRLELPVMRTGTDNIPVLGDAVTTTATATTEVSYDEPAFMRNPTRNTARSLEIPTFLRKQAD